MINKIQSGQSKRLPISDNSFLEALRGSGGGAKKTLPQTGMMAPGQTVDFAAFQEQRQRFERQGWAFQQDYLDLRRREQVIWTKQEQEVKLQVQAILNELKQIATSTKTLTKEVEVAAMQAPVEAGVYHVNFFEKLRLALVELRKRVEESATWLAAFNQKSKKRNYYWAQFKKSGTKYTLSADRYMATQVG